MVGNDWSEKHLGLGMVGQQGYLNITSGYCCLIFMFQPVGKRLPSPSASTANDFQWLPKIQEPKYYSNPTCHHPSSLEPTPKSGSRGHAVVDLLSKQLAEVLFQTNIEGMFLSGKIPH